MAGREIESVYVGIAGGHIKGFNSHGIIAVKNREVMDADKVFEYSQIRTGGDDAAFFQQKIPGVYWVLGVQNEAKGFDKPHHNAYFDFDDANLALGAAVQAQAVTDFLTKDTG